MEYTRELCHSLTRSFSQVYQCLILLESYTTQAEEMTLKLLLPENTYYKWTFRTGVQCCSLRGRAGDWGCIRCGNYRYAIDSWIGRIRQVYYSPITDRRSPRLGVEYYLECTYA